MKILGLCGSLRAGSYNKRLLQHAKGIAAGLGHELLGDGSIDIPLFNDDIAKTDFPVSVQKLVDLAAQADVLLVASPEYNHSVTGVLKNALDWLSINSKPLKGKVAAVFGASSGIMGSVRSQIHLKQVLGNLDMFMLFKPEVYVREGETAFDEQGNLKDPKTVEQLTKLLVDTFAFAEKLRG
jgi:chromate reductase